MLRVPCDVVIDAVAVHSPAADAPLATAAARNSIDATALFMRSSGLREIERLHQERGHLSASVRRARAVEERRRLAASRDLLGVELLDPVGERSRARGVLEQSRARRRSV